MRRAVLALVLAGSFAAAFAADPPRNEKLNALFDREFKRGDGYHKVTGVLHVTLKHTKLPDGSMGPVEEVYHLDADSVEQS